MGLLNEIASLIGWFVIFFIVIACGSAFFYGYESGESTNTPIENEPYQPPFPLSPTPIPTPHFDYEIPVSTPTPEGVVRDGVYYDPDDWNPPASAFKDNTPFRDSSLPNVWEYTLHDSPIPNEYYMQDCWGLDGENVYEYLDNIEWTTEYERNAFDCSQMAAYLEWRLTNCGYNVVIRGADVEGEDYGHAWILMEFSEGWLAYECTGLYWVYPDKATAESYVRDDVYYYESSYYTAGVSYESIYDIWNYYKQFNNGREAFIQEYGFWI